MVFLNYLAAAMKIHVSNSCAQLLLQAGGFELEKRGTIQVKVCLSTHQYSTLYTILFVYDRAKTQWLHGGLMVPIVQNKENT